MYKSILRSSPFIKAPPFAGILPHQREGRNDKRKGGDGEVDAITILGSEWAIAERSEVEDVRLKDCDGYTDWTAREIVVEREVNGNLKNMEAYVRKVKRHEIVHAFLLESGLAECSDWAQNEEMVDWIARMGPKIHVAWQAAGAI